MAALYLDEKCPVLLDKNYICGVKNEASYHMEQLQPSTADRGGTFTSNLHSKFLSCVIRKAVDEINSNDRLVESCCFLLL